MQQGACVCSLSAWRTSPQSQVATLYTSASESPYPAFSTTPIDWTSGHSPEPACSVATGLVLGQRLVATARDSGSSGAKMTT
jgi:hypothetical protein